jgi:DNA-binding CsgD family transcriptional regulator
MKTPTFPVSLVLSRRQEEILQAACEGLPDKLIADRLGISPRTPEGHWRAIHHKLGSVNRCQARLIFTAPRESTQWKVPA